MNFAINASVLGSAAGASLAQTKGSETERQARDGAVRDRQAQSADLAEKAAGIGQTQEDSQSEERDADGRRIWELDQQRKKGETSADDEHHLRQARDPSGMSGTSLDLTG